MWILLKGVSSIGREIVETMVLNHGSLQQQEDILNKSNVSPSDAERFERAYRQYWRPAKVEVLRRFLNDAVVVDTGDDIVGIWIVKNYDVLQHHLSDIANFLKNQTTSGKFPLRGNNWEERVDSLFRDDLIG
jgi:hypothetical protein